MPKQLEKKRGKKYAERAKQNEGEKEEQKTQRRKKEGKTVMHLILQQEK